MVSEDCRGKEASGITDTLKRAALVQRAFQLEWVTIICMMVETAVAIGAGIAAHSLLLFLSGPTASLRLSRLASLSGGYRSSCVAAGLSPKRPSSVRAVLPALCFLRSPST